MSTRDGDHRRRPCVDRDLPDLNNPTAANADTSIEKNAGIGERLRLTFRAERFHSANHVVFSGPTTSIPSARFGGIMLSQANTPRRAQFNLRLGF
jgi:hypothetical protein